MSHQPRLKQQVQVMRMVLGRTRAELVRLAALSPAALAYLARSV